jgi:hypothetical protein
MIADRVRSAGFEERVPWCRIADAVRLCGQTRGVVDRIRSPISRRTYGPVPCWPSWFSSRSITFVRRCRADTDIALHMQRIEVWHQDRHAVQEIALRIRTPGSCGITTAHGSTVRKRLCDSDTWSLQRR